MFVCGEVRCCVANGRIFDDTVLLLLLLLLLLISHTTNTFETKTTTQKNNHPNSNTTGCVFYVLVEESVYIFLITNERRNIRCLCVLCVNGTVLGAALSTTQTTVHQIPLPRSTPSSTRLPKFDRDKYMKFVFVHVMIIFLCTIDRFFRLFCGFNSKVISAFNSAISTTHSQNTHLHAL